jgi:hypothetical protein
MPWLSRNVCSHYLSNQGVAVDRPLHLIYPVGNPLEKLLRHGGASRGQGFARISDLCQTSGGDL